MPIKPKAIYVGPEQIGSSLASKRTEWDFVASVPDISSLWDGLNSGAIDHEVQVIITLDHYFVRSGEDASFEQLVSVMSPFCLFLIVQYHPELEPQIRDRVEAVSNSSGANSAEYFFVDPRRPNVSIDNAVKYYINNSENHDVADILAGRDPQVRYEVEAAAVKEVAPANINNTFYEEEQPSDRLGQIIAVTSSKGGSGKSTIALSMAAYLAHTSQNSVKEGLEERPLKIVVLDLDIYDGQIGFLIGSIKPTVLNMRSKGINEETLKQTLIHSERLGVDLLLAPKRPRLSDDTPPEFYLELIQFLKRNYDYVILDTSVSYLDPLLEKVAYPMADLIVFITDIVVNSVYSMTRWVQEVTKPKSQMGMGINPNKIGIVVNKSISNVNMSGEKIAKSALGIPVVTVVPNNAKLFAHAANLQSLESVLKHPDIKLSIRRLARAVVGKRYKLSDNIF